MENLFKNKIIAPESGKSKGQLTAKAEGGVINFIRFSIQRE